MSGLTLDHADHRSDEKRFTLSENMRGALIVLAAMVTLIAMIYVVMVEIAGPGGWAVRAAGSAYAGEASLVSGPLPGVPD